MEMIKFLSLSDEEILRIFDKPIGTCVYSKCGQEVRSSQEHRSVPAGVYHTDCYFNEWGDEIERNPICSPRRIGGYC